MQIPAMPQDEAKRIQELISLELLDSEDEASFDSIVSLAAHITGCPVSLISLVDSDRQWFKAKVGTEVPQTPRDISFCAHAIHSDDLFVIENTLDDTRFRDNPLVSADPNIRFYAGQPLVTSNGYRLGTLCAIDVVPRQLTAEQLKHLSALAKQVIHLIELRRVNRKQKQQTLTQSQFLANISHEIRTPMTGILGYAFVAQEALIRDRAAEKAITYLENIERHSKHVLSIIGNVLDLSKAESSTIELDIGNFSVNELKTHVLSLFELEAKKKQLSLSFQISDQVPLLLSADFTRLKQILINVVGNSIKFTEKGSIAVLADYDSSTSILKFSVKDTGFGMSVDQSERLFKPFMQADASIVTKYGGTGLGLAISKQIAEAMGGGLSLTHSAPGEGSEFLATIHAPLTQVQIAADSSTPKLDAIQNTLKSIGSLASVLVADDSEDNRFIFKHYLKQFSIQADEAESGADVFEMMKHKKYDVIFLDLEMQGENGFAILENIRRVRKHIKVVAFTAHNTLEYRKKSLEKGFDAFLAKPFDLTQVGEILFETLIYSS